VDGKNIYVYGEGWNFGEVANNARGINATQLNIGGTGIGAFNDRLRDGARGGTPFGDPREQGFATGLFFAPNAAEGRDKATQQSELADAVDWIRLGLAGSLKSYPIQRSNGDIVPGERVLYNGSGAGYTLDPQENILYVSAHDNETLFDAVQTKASSGTPLAERIRMNNLALSLVMFGQGVPFFHAGDDLLRSKSLDRNSYDSGDWFNRLDWTMQTNNWGVGLPLDGGEKAEIFAPLLADPALKPSPADIAFSAAVFQEYMRIRKSSPLFRLSSAAQIERMLTFLNTGPDQTPGLIVMRLEDKDHLDPRYREIVVFFNAAPEGITFRDPALAGDYRLHPLQAESVDARLREAGYAPESGFKLPGRSAVVFVLPDAPPIAAILEGAAALAALAGGAALLSRRKKK
jgi:pullulanase-type alpha-1,6-glucosidase